MTVLKTSLVGLTDKRNGRIGEFRHSARDSRRDVDDDQSLDWPAADDRKNSTNLRKLMKAWQPLMRREESWPMACSFL